MNKQKRVDTSEIRDELRRTFADRLWSQGMELFGFAHGYFAVHGQPMAIAIPHVQYPDGEELFIYHCWNEADIEHAESELHLKVYRRVQPAGYNGAVYQPAITGHATTCRAVHPELSWRGKRVLKGRTS